MQHLGDQGGHPRGHILENPAITHLRVNHRTKNLVRRMNRKGDTVDSFIFRLLMSNGGSNNSLHLAGYHVDNAGLFFKRHRYSDEQQIRGFTNAVLDTIDKNSDSYYNHKTSPRTRFNH